MIIFYHPEGRNISTAYIFASPKNADKFCRLLIFVLRLVLRSPFIGVWFIATRNLTSLGSLLAPKIEFFVLSISALCICSTSIIFPLYLNIAVVMLVVEH